MKSTETFGYRLDRASSLSGFFSQPLTLLEPGEPDPPGGGAKFNGVTVILSIKNIRRKKCYIYKYLQSRPLNLAPPPEGLAHPVLIGLAAEKKIPTN